MVKFIQALIISKDDKLYTAKSETYCQVQSSNLNEELGQIEYVFSDKTGTLTCNEMVFKKLVLKGKAYGNNYNATYNLDKFTPVTNVDFM
jgi:phospholipid-transporting ATPase